MPLDRAALIGCGVTTGLGAVFNTAKVEPGTTVAVIGCGGIGLNCIQGAAIAGAGRVIAVDMVDEKLELAEAVRRDRHRRRVDGDPIAQVQEMTRRRRALLVRGDRPEGHRRAGVRDAARAAAPPR